MDKKTALIVALGAALIFEAGRRSGVTATTRRLGSATADEGLRYLAYSDYLKAIHKKGPNNGH